MEPLMNYDDLKFDFEFDLWPTPRKLMGTIRRNMRVAGQVVAGYVVLVLAAGATYTALRLSDVLARRRGHRYGKRSGWVPPSGLTGASPSSPDATSPG